MLTFFSHITTYVISVTPANFLEFIVDISWINEIGYELDTKKARHKGRFIMPSINYHYSKY